METFKVTVVIPIWNSRDWICDCFSSLSKQTYSQFYIVVVDNGSEDDSLEILKGQSSLNLQVISLSKNLGFAAAVNIGIKSVITPYVVLLNIDTRPDCHWLEKLVEAMDNAPESVTSLASKMLSMGNPQLVDSAGDQLSWYGSARKRGHGQNECGFVERQLVFSACAGAALYRTSLFKEIGYFDERFTSYFEDIDLGFREKLYGYKTLYVPEAKVLHYGHSAGVAGEYYVFLLTRNRLLTLLKNVPILEFFRHFFQIFYGQLYYFLIYKKPKASMNGYFSAFLMMADIFRDRKVIQANSKRKSIEIKKILDSQLGEPSLRELMMRKIL